MPIKRDNWTDTQIIKQLVEKYSRNFKGIKRWNPLLDHEIEILENWPPPEEVDLYESACAISNGLKYYTLNELYKFQGIVWAEIVYRNNNKEEGNKRLLGFRRKYLLYDGGNLNDHSTPHPYYYMAFIYEALDEVNVAIDSEIGGK